MPTRAITSMSAKANRVHGSNLPTISSPRRNGLTVICSPVPCSRSRTKVTAVCWIVTIMMITTISPGIRKSDDFCSGLYQVRSRGSISPA